MPEPVRDSVHTAAPDDIVLCPDVSLDIDELTGDGDRLPHAHSIVGDLLSGWYDDWIIVERERLELRRIATLERIAARHLAAGECASAIDVALIAIGADPYRESLHRIVIEAHTAEGNHSEAICHYRRLRRVLEDGLGAQPSMATERLVVELATRTT